MKVTYEIIIHIREIGLENKAEFDNEHTAHKFLTKMAKAAESLNNIK